MVSGINPLAQDCLCCSPQVTVGGALPYCRRRTQVPVSRFVALGAGRFAGRGARCLPGARGSGLWTFTPFVALVYPGLYHLWFRSSTTGSHLASADLPPVEVWPSTWATFACPPCPRHRPGRRRCCISGDSPTLTRADPGFSTCLARADIRTCERHPLLHEAARWNRGQ